MNLPAEPTGRTGPGPSPGPSRRRAAGSAGTGSSGTGSSGTGSSGTGSSGTGSSGTGSAGSASTETFLAEAERLLGDDSGQPGAWPRAAVWLTRLALERALDEFWADRLPQARGAPMRAQLLLLPHQLPDTASSSSDVRSSTDVPSTNGGDTELDVAARARQAWLGLSRAAHHHAFELAPTAAELRTWHREVTAVVTALRSCLRTPAPARHDAPGQPPDH